MIHVSVKLLGEYAKSADGPVLLELEESSVVSDLVEALFSLLSNGFKDSFMDPRVQNLSQRSLVLVRGVEIGVLSGLKTVLRDLDEVLVIPVSHGG